MSGGALGCGGHRLQPHGRCGRGPAGLAKHKAVGVGTEGWPGPFPSRLLPPRRSRLFSVSPPGLQRARGGGIISVAEGQQSSAHTSKGALLGVNVTEGAPAVPGNGFRSCFVSPTTLLKRPRSKALWEAARRPVAEVAEG